MKRLTKADLAATVDDLEDKFREMRYRHETELRQLRGELPVKQSDLEELKYNIDNLLDRLSEIEHYVWNFIVEKGDE